MLRLKKLTSIVATGAMIVSMFAGMTFTSFADETTTVTTQAQLAAMSDGNYVLAANITIDGSTWTPVSAFSGTLDGTGYTITWDGDTVEGASNFAIIGTNTGTVQNVTVNGSLTVTGSNLDYISPVVGYNSGTIKDVTNNAALTATESYNVGGIAGYNNAGLVNECDNTGAISGLSKTGGIVGENAGTVSNCENTGNIRSYGGGKDGTGGIVGRNGNNNTAVTTGIIENCSSTGAISDISATGTTGRWVGGIAGFQNSLSRTTNCTSSGTLTAYRDSGHPIGKDEGTTSSSTEIASNYTISAGGSYTITGNTAITVTTSDAVTIKGNDTAHAVTIDCTAAANLTIEALQVSAPATSSSNIINFTTGTNTLTLSGTSLLENDRSASGAMNHAAIRVPSGVTLNTAGSGTLYLYKNSMGAGIGSNTNEASGTINFSHTGAIFAKGSMTGAVIGGDTGVGNITVNSGELNLIAKARGAALGGSAQCNGGAVVLNGGNVKITCDFSGHAIGSGASGTDGGTLTINGGSLYVEATSNSSLTDATLINATIIPSNTACLTLPISSTFSGGEFTVSVDDSEFYTGKVNTASANASATTTSDSWGTAGASEVYLWIPTTTSSLTISGGSNQPVEYETIYDNGWTLLVLE